MQLVDGSCLWSNTICANVALVNFHYLWAGYSCSLWSLFCELTHSLCSPVVLIGPSQPNYLATNVVFLEFSLNCWNTLLLNSKVTLDVSHSIDGAPSIFVSTGYVDFWIYGCVTFCGTHHHPRWQNDRGSLVERNRGTMSALRSNTVYSSFEGVEGWCSGLKCAISEPVILTDEHKH